MNEKIRKIWNKRKVSGIIALIVFMSVIPVLNAPIKVDAAVNVDMYVERVFWGTPPNNVQVVSPGARNVPLTVIIHNNSNFTLRGVVGDLELIYPFRDTVTESNKSRAEGQPIQAGDVFNQTGDILPSGSFSLTFNLDIDDDAVKGAYYMNLTVTYNVQVNGTFRVGEPKKFQIKVILNNQAPVIYSYNPQTNPVTLTVGEWAQFQIKASDPDNDTITIEWVYDGETIGYGENFTFTANESEVGSHTFEVQVSDGNLTTTNTWTIVINRRIETNVTASTDFLYAGRVNEVHVNISNNIWVGTVTVNLAVPQQIALLSDSSYTFENVTEGQVLSVTAEIYVPEALVGQSGVLSITIVYRDSNGNNYNENYNLGLAVRGLISMKVYDIIVDPSLATPGQKITISGTLLNTGNVLAKFTNITLETTDVIEPEYVPYTYIGDVDANSPTPFSFNAYVKNVTPGTYKVKFKVKYTDDLYEEHEFTFTVYIRVIASNENTQSTGEENQQPVGNELLYLGTTILVILILVVAYVRKKGE